MNATASKTSPRRLVLELYGNPPQLYSAEFYPGGTHGPSRLSPGDFSCGILTTSFCYTLIEYVIWGLNSENAGDYIVKGENKSPAASLWRGIDHACCVRDLITINRICIVNNIFINVKNAAGKNKKIPRLFKIVRRELPPESIEIICETYQKHAIRDKETLLLIAKALYASEPDWSDSSKEPTYPEIPAEALRKYASKIRKVKTIWQTGKPVDLESFYYPCRLNRISNEVSTCSDLPNRLVLLRGIAGQGKSVLLRHICAGEITKEGNLAVFVELYRAGAGTPVHNLINEELKTEMHVSEPAAMFAQLAKSGRLTVCLDGFDEVWDQQEVVLQIKSLADYNQRLRIVVTSRPYTRMEYATDFWTIDIDKLTPDDVNKLIQKLSKEKETVKELNAYINGKDYLFSLLTTPLMVTLLVINYKASGLVPDHISGFYEELFSTLLRRHDATKLTFRRVRRSNLDDTQFRRVFDFLCFLVRFSGNAIEFDRERLELVVSDALIRSKITAEPSAYVDDVCLITSLIIRDGAYFSFIHRTVVEYFTASYLGHCDESVQDFYKLCTEDSGVREKFARELGFLAEIDRIRYLNFYFVGSVDRFIDQQDRFIFFRGDKPSIPASLMRFYQSSRLVWRRRANGDVEVTWIFIDDCGVPTAVAHDAIKQIIRSYDGPLVLSEAGIRIMSNSETIPHGASEYLIKWNGASGNKALDELHLKWVSMSWDLLWSQCVNAIELIRSSSPNKEISKLRSLLVRRT
jgi:hypothetical protein